MSEDVYSSLAKILVGLYYEKNPTLMDSGFGFISRVLEPLDLYKYGVNTAVKSISADSHGVTLEKTSGVMSFSKTFSYDQIPHASKKEEAIKFIENILRENVF